MSAYRGKADIVHIPSSAGTSALDYCLAEPDRVFCLKLGLGAFRWATKLYSITPITLTGGPDSFVGLNLPLAFATLGKFRTKTSKQAQVGAPWPALPARRRSLLPSTGPHQRRTSDRIAHCLLECILVVIGTKRTNRSKRSLVRFWGEADMARPPLCHSNRSGRQRSGCQSRETWGQRDWAVEPSGRACWQES